MKNFFIKLIISYLFFFCFSASAIIFEGKFIQGHFILGKTDPDSKIWIDKKSIIKKVIKREYLIQRIDGLPTNQVTPPPEVYEKIKKDNLMIGKARSINSKLVYFKDNFIYPIDKYIITGVYGSQRILNGKPRRPHYGVDFHAPEGTPVKSMMSGVVVLAEKDMYFTGGTIIFDHGHGISTLYMHMKDISVRVGEKVRKGQIVGTLGQSGRATGPHLDIRLNWFDVKLDPLTILN